MTGRTIPVTRTDGSEVASEATQALIHNQLDLKNSEVVADLRGTGGKTLTDLWNELASTLAVSDSDANSALANILTKLNSTLNVEAYSLPLPTDAATSANQTTANTSLSGIDGGIGGASAAAAGDTGASTTNGFLRWMRDFWLALKGTKTAANSLSVTGASDSTFLTADQQARAWRDDGTESGIIRTEQKRGALVQMPFIYGTYTAVTGGAATATLTGPLASDINQDGSGTYLRVTVQASASLANYVYVKFWIFGNVFGLRMQRSASTPVGCMIDGVAYTVPAVDNIEPSSGATSSVYGNVDGGLIADDLGPGRHFVELAFPAFLSGSNRVYVVGGYLVDSAAGYQRLPGQVVSTSNGTLALTATTGGTAQYPAQPAGIRGWRKALFYNTTGSPITVYMVYSLATSTIIWSKSVPANDSIELDPQGIIVDVINTRFYVSGSGVNATFVWAV